MFKPFPVNMLAKVDTDIIQEAIRVCLRLSPPITGSLTLEARDAKLYLHSAAELSRCTILIPGEVQGKALFAIPTDALKDATKGRGEVELSFDKTMLNVKAGRYIAKLSTLDAIEPDEEEKVDGTKWVLSVEQIQWLKEAVANTALKPTQNLTTYMPVSVKITGKSAFVSCYDTNHMMFESTKEVTGDLDITLPLETLQAILDVFNKVECEMTVTPATLVVKNPIVDVTLALPATEDDAIAADLVREKARESLKVDGKQVELDKKAVTQFLDNARSVYDKSRSELQVEVEPGQVMFTVKTTNGTAKNKLKASTKATASFRIDLEYFEEAARKSGEKVSFKYADSFLVFRTSQSHALIALNQE